MAAKIQIQPVNPSQTEFLVTHSKQRTVVISSRQLFRAYLFAKLAPSSPAVQNSTEHKFLCHIS
jgi:hypothetical protein